VKQRDKILLIILFVALGAILVNTIRSRLMINRLTGYIEFVSDWGIQRFILSTAKKEEILKKNPYLITSFDISPNGKDRALEGNSLGTPDGLIMYLNSSEFKPILSGKLFRNPSFSPDGQWIAYLSDEHRGEKKYWFDDWALYIIRTDGSSEQKVSNLVLDVFNKPSWFPDGKKMVVSTKDWKIYIVDSKTGNTKKMIEFGRAPSISHDGKNLAYLSKEVDSSLKKKILDLSTLTVKEYEGAEKKRGPKFKELMQTESEINRLAIYLYNVQTGQTRRLTSKQYIEGPPIWSPDDKYLLYNLRSDLMGDRMYVLDIETGATAGIPSAYGRIMAWAK